MASDYKPNSLAIKILRLFLANRDLIIGADRLANMFNTSPTQVRQTLAPAVGRHILRKELDDLTGEQDYAAGRSLGEMAHLQPTAQEMIQGAQESSAQQTAEAPPPSRAAADADQADAELAAIINYGLQGSRIDLDDLQLCDIPAPSSRAGAVSRYDGHFREALESGRAITMPPVYVKTVANAARSWARRHAPKHEVKSCGRLTGCHFGAIWITAVRKKKDRA
ncbi:MAG: hypothetical protein A2486_16225 [Burkholderiales bacterium RIFOXYC12_FULL_65_23]|uniref:hypothetical protein n=1 Tax=Malikia spinosa TaxID=86180 RepID=UPI0008CD8CDD|nr:MAG: hypothetical protein A2486_16225 [Burkholderiales bacterium RIFOXYC12_FULL_65_23]